MYIQCYIDCNLHKIQAKVPLYNKSIYDNKIILVHIVFFNEYTSCITEFKVTLNFTESKNMCVNASHIGNNNMYIDRKMIHMYALSKKGSTTKNLIHNKG